jgi:DNA-binding IscR family transcriptional regulator
MLCLATIGQQVANATIIKEAQKLHLQVVTQIYQQLEKKEREPPII